VSGNVVGRSDLSCTVCALEFRLGARRCPRCGAEVGSQGDEVVVDDRTRDRSKIEAELDSSDFGASWLAPQFDPPGTVAFLAPGAFVPRPAVAAWAQPGPSGVALQIGVRASAGTRLIAFVIDSLILGAVYFVVVLALSPIEMLMPGKMEVVAEVAMVAGNTLALVGSAFYLVLLNGRGQTLGKQLLHLAVVDRVSGSPIGSSRAFVRYLLFVAMIAPLGLGLLSIPLSSKLCGWHDRAADDLVVVLPPGR